MTTREKEARETERLTWQQWDGATTEQRRAWLAKGRLVDYTTNPDACPTCYQTERHAPTCDAPPRSEGAQGIEAGPMYRAPIPDTRCKCGVRNDGDPSGLCWVCRSPAPERWECWTCRRPKSGDPLRVSDFPGGKSCVDQHRSAGHDVREVSK